MKIYLGNLSYEATEEDLKLALEQYGKVESVVIISDKFNGRSKGFGFAEMESSAEAQAAIEGLNGKELKGRALNVSEARAQSESGGGRRGPSGGAKGGYGRGGGRR